MPDSSTASAAPLRIERELAVGRSGLRIDAQRGLHAAAGHAEAQRIQAQHGILHHDVRIDILDRQLCFAEHALAGEMHVGIHRVPAFDVERFDGQHLGAGLARGQGEIDDRVAGVGGHVERLWRCNVVWRGERLAIGEDTDAALNSELAERRQVLIELQLHQTPRIGPKRFRSRADQGVGVPILLLEMLRAEEEALAPGYATLALHTDAPRSPPPI